eukprot:CAMPEP_0170764652 /NCGR_PEP_ID=MMETSP0733-20121128/4138_1 /TAXON_ID=186038 /ORGANISM="Fragilariopsis kerguelensis, Strain L26-C5" /LENGTH=1350 /DNA_ID=CAMNT_0011105355 /DNA_START=28 /DNA_END=4082 /DNA_ORIENTATION=+
MNESANVRNDVSEESPISPSKLATSESPTSTPHETTSTATHQRQQPTKLRRNVSVEESIDNAVSVQRLVEYFLVVSCQPRWGTTSTTSTSIDTTATATTTATTKEGSPSQTPRTPTLNRRSQAVSANQKKTYDNDNYKKCNDDREGVSPKRIGRSLKEVVENHEKTGTDHAINHTLSPDHYEDVNGYEPSSTILPPPTPREKWNRNLEEEEEVGDNIRFPDMHIGNDSYTFAPKVTARFPLEDHADHPLNPMVTQFCFPVGDIIIPAKEYRMPSVHHFVMTNEKGRKLYGTCLTIYEDYQPPANTPWKNHEKLHSTTVGEAGIEVSVNSEDNQLYIPRCLCIVSIWPYVTAFREYLAQLYRLATSTDCMKAPIERYVMNLCMEIPAPPPGSFEVKICILDSVIRIWGPPAKLPIAYVALPYHILFDCLDIENILHLWYCLTMERKVILVSSQHSILTVSSEILCSLLYPMKWSHLYVPLLPKFLCPILSVPYLCGVTRDNWMHAQQFVCDETIVVDLDRNSVMFGQRTVELPPVPGKKWSKLHHSLQEIAGHLFWRGRGLETEYQQFIHNKISQYDFKEIAEQKGEQVWREKLQTLDQAFNLQYTPDSEHLLDNTVNDMEQNQWDRLQEAFLRFFVAILKDYRKFLHISEDSKLDPGSSSSASNDWLSWGNNHKFDKDSFIASQKPEYFSYLSGLCSMQQFDDFITKRLYSPELPDIIFFDQSIDAKLNRSRLKLKKVHTPFLQSAKVHKQLETFVAVEPNKSDISGAPFIYETWPEKFDHSLFCRPRPIPSMITAEFDRQASLIKQLQMNYSSSVDKRADLVNFYGSDYDYSPEGMSFTVFFFTYSAIIGREWQEYNSKRNEIESGIPVLTSEILSENIRVMQFLSENTTEKNVRKDEVRSTDIRNGESLASSEPHIPTDFTLELCNSGSIVCPDGEAAVENAISYMTSKSPCPDINTGAQAAYDSLSNFALSLDPTKGCRNKSLLDNDDEFAEYEEARAVAVAQLDLAFDALQIMETRGLRTDPDVFKSLMEACGRCGDTKRAFELIEIMKRDGLVANHDVLVFFVASFAHCRADQDSKSLPNGEGFPTQHHNSDAYSHFLKKKLNMMKDGSQGNIFNMRVPSDEESIVSDGLSDSGSELSIEHVSSAAFLQFFASNLTTTKTKKTKKRKQKKRSSIIQTDNLSDRLKKQLVLGKSLLEFLYPDISIETYGDACPMCSNIMKEEDIVSGWKQCDFQDFTTCCPQCSHRFVSRFKVSCSSPTFEGSQGPGSSLYCEFLSPWVLRKELSHIIGSSNSIEQILNPEWRSGRDVRATIWWNMIAMFKRYQLPFSFLLQGSFQNRLINPIPQD